MSDCAPTQGLHGAGVPVAHLQLGQSLQLLPEHQQIMLQQRQPRYTAIHTLEKNSMLALEFESMISYLIYILKVSINLLQLLHL